MLYNYNLAKSFNTNYFVKAAKLIKFVVRITKAQRSGKMKKNEKSINVSLLISTASAISLFKIRIRNASSYG